MNAITHNFYDAATGKIDFPAWKANDAEHAKQFRDYSLSDWMVNDQVGRAFLTPQLHRIEAETYIRKYPSFDFASFMTVNEDGDMWDVGTVFYSMDAVGRAEFMSGKSFDMPYASTILDQFTHGYHLAALGYEWTVQEMERAAKLGRSLPSDKAMAVDMGVQSTLFSLAMTGRLPGDTTSEKGWTGLVNNGSVPVANFAADGTGSARTWASKTPDQISRDFWEAINAVETATGETHIATTAVLPTSRLRYLESTRMTDTGSSVLAYILGGSANSRTVNVRGSRLLETAGASSTARMIAYDNTQEVVRFHLPGRHTFLEPFRKASMVWEVPGIMNVGGTEVRLPKAIAYRDGL
ncbi:DUF2184 domain-containing protein [Sphingobium sp. BS19]|uniref:DUF2184 domain-containing protein n=1 Tax=Sphingobium sp. BS19 TaxID=3018973 RepID=UPI0022EDBF3C|nr:DUF2184 domain-containing protein [Sphingobium sp. BS19]GLI99135.1 hypothetical protein Sbs19_29530 [Sphingobium sp. BS19]